MTERSNTPIADMGDDFQIDVMPDYDDRINSGEFANKTEDEIRAIYVQEEADDNHEREQRRLDEEEEDHDD